MKIESADIMKGLPTQFFATLVAKVGQAVKAGHDIINLGQGNPDQPTPAHIVEEMQRAVANPTHHKYSPFQGRRELKEAMAHWYLQEHGVELDPEQEVAIVFGGKTGLIEVCQVLLNPGDVCLVPDPGYPDYWSGVALTGAEMSFMPLRESADYLPDFHEISQDHLNKAKLMFLNYPNNPTSATAPLSFFEETVRFAEKHGVVVCHDFAYGAIGFDGNKPISFLQAPGAKEVGVEVYTLSKTYNMAGWRVGFVVGNREIVRLVNLLQDHLFVSLFGAVQMAGAHALTAPQDCVRQLVSTYESRRNVFFEGLKEIGWKAQPPRGSFFSWLPVPNGYTSVSFADKLLEEAHIVVAPGKGFGSYGEGYVRVGLLTDEERLKEAVARLDRLNLFK
ncbi:pyridoxal phosphate-dependent aminotransferase [Ammoniphilus sp. YIM 78166]|uniref:pyridoxal phosphate-dependent aminotransferase n=1 Tax=Ammoniphilus sp. YIM 78166 TaxID=1644106 RepID=UPI00106FA94D|nr:pyridoxal phosphate-dependent aminotransferase [Ammoniphilus sp. YIM 78166]